MNSCPFCNGEVIKYSSMNGYPTMQTAIENMLSMFGGQPKHDERLSMGIQLQDGNRLCWDSSAREYAVCDVEIRYCPFCGKELEPKS